jgi:hypothetical protein
MVEISLRGFSFNSERFINKDRGFKGGVFRPRKGLIGLSLEV